MYNGVLSSGQGGIVAWVVGGGMFDGWDVPDLLAAAGLDMRPIAPDLVRGERGVREA